MVVSRCIGVIIRVSDLTQLRQFLALCRGGSCDFHRPLALNDTGTAHEPARALGLGPLTLTRAIAMIGLMEEASEPSYNQSRRARLLG